MDPRIEQAARCGEYATVLRLAREYRAWTQVELGDRVGLNRTGISRLENGRQPLVDVELLQHLADTLRMPRWIFGLAADPPPTLTGSRHEDEGDDVRRRQMLTAAGLVLAGVRLGVPADTPRRITPETVLRVRQLTEQYRSDLYQAGAGTSVRRAITALLDHTTTLIGHTSDEQVRRDLLDAFGDLAGVAAYAYRDLGAHDLAQEHYVLAIQAAKAAGDEPLIGHLVVRMAGHHIELAQPGDVHHYLNAAGHTSTRFSPGELSNQCAIAAWAHAQAEDPNQVRRHVGLAEEHFAGHTHATTDQDRGWQIRHTAEAELFSLTGAAYTELARHQPRHAPEAISRLTRALTLRAPGFSRNATLDTISLAEAYLATHDLDLTAHYATRAVQLSRDGTSQRVQDRLAKLVDSVRPYRQRDDIATVIQLVDG